MPVMLTDNVAKKPEEFDNPFIMAVVLLLKACRE